MPDLGVVPAVVCYGPGRRALVLHASGDDAENAVLARARLVARGFKVVPPPADIEPFLSGLNTDARSRALRILQALGLKGAR